MEQKKCYICQNSAKVDSQTGKDIHKVECVACGSYEITESLINVSQYTKEQLFELSTVVFHKNIVGFKDRLIDTSNVELLINEYPKSLDQRMEWALQNICGISEEGIKVSIEYPQIVCASKKENSNIAFMLYYLVSLNFIRTNNLRGLEMGFFDEGTQIIVTPEGWKKNYDLKTKNTDSKQVFVAMWFDRTMDSVYEKGVKKAIEDLKFTSLRIDEKEHNQKICDQIIAEIKKSKFVICDFTGQRGGVYFEAGYAMGIGIPVIWTCKENGLKDCHFDTRQYNHIAWKDEDDLYEKLKYRIQATIL